MMHISKIQHIISWVTINTTPRLTSLLFVLLLLINLLGYAQTGPGGVGNAEGTDNQPENVIWLDAGTLSLTDNAPVISWPDQSGNGLDFGPLGIKATPTFQSNGLNSESYPVVRFDGTERYLTLNDNDKLDANLSELTIFIVSRSAILDGQPRGILSKRVSSNSQESYSVFTYQSNYLNFDIRNTQDNRLVSTTGLNTTTDYVSTLRFDGTKQDIFLQGVNTSSGTVRGSGNVANTSADLILGALNENYGTYFDGDIAEILIYNDAVTEAQRTLVENYLSQKYGIALDASATDAYGNGANFSTAYKHDVGGIGKNGTDIHTEGGSAGVYVSAVSAASLNDADYVMLGHQNGASTSTTSDLVGTFPAITHRWTRDWYLEKTATTIFGSNVYLEFDFPEGVTGGQYPQVTDNYYLLYRAAPLANYSVVSIVGKAKVNGDRMQFELPGSLLANGYYTIGTSDDTESPILGGPARTWYSYTNGNWSNANTWTLDGSAFPDYDNPSGEVPSAVDDVVITDSKAVTIQGTTNLLEIASLEVIGTLDLTSSYGHDFTTVSGAGTIRLAGRAGTANFVEATLTDFADATTGGTVEIYGSGLNLDQSLTFNNLIINLDNADDEVNVMADYTLNGDLDIQRGTLQVDDGTAGVDLTMTVYGDVLVQNTGNVRVGDANQRHQVDLYGNFTNQGTAYFTNRTTADYTNEATDGIVDVNFLNTSADQVIQCDGECRFYRVEIAKAEATDDNATYILDINASSTANFNLLGYAGQGHGSTAQLTTNSNALGLLSGTVRVNANVVIGALNNTGNFNISERARLWVNGGEVHKTEGSSTVPYGVVRVSSGILESDVPSGITVRDDGQIVIEGGQVLTRQIRTSVLGSGNVGGYTQTGGNVILDGTEGTQGDYSMFSMTYPQNVFAMSAGTLTIRNSTGRGHIFINSDSYNVTGGTIIIEVNSTNQYKIDSKAPLYNLTLQKTSASTAGMEVELGAITNEGPENATVGATELYILNDLRLASSAGGFATQLDPHQVDILIGGDLYLEQGSALQSPSNEETAANTGIIKFVDSGTRVIDLDNQTSTVSFQYLTVAKDNPTDRVTVINAPSTALQIEGELRVEKGTLDHGAYTIEAQGDLYLTDSIGTATAAGRLLLDGSATQTITTTDAGGTVHHLELTNNTGFALSGGDLTVVDRLALSNGVFNIGASTLMLQGNLASETKTDYSATTMIQMDGDASNEGFSRLITADGTVLYPIGTNANADVRYTPAEATLTGVSDNGYLSVHPVDKVLETTESAGDILSYYWNVTHRDFSSSPTVTYQFGYAESDLDGSPDESSFVGGSVLDETPYTRSYEDDGIPESETIDGVNNIITFNGDSDTGLVLEQTNYTAGASSRFVGTPTVYYSRVSSGNWSNTSTWSTAGYGGAAASSIPGAGDVVYIGYSGSPSSYQRHRVTVDVGSPGAAYEIADLVLEQNPEAGLVEGNMSRMIVPPTRGLRVAGKVRGNGEIQFQMSNASIPALDADLDEFADTEGASFIMRSNSGNVTAPTNLTKFPRLSIPGSSPSYDDSRSVTFAVDVTCQNLNVRYGGTLLMSSGSGGNVHVKDSLRVGGIGTNNEGRIIFQNTGSARVITVGGDVVFDTDGARDANQLYVQSGGTANINHQLSVGGEIALRDDDSLLDLFTADDGTASNVILNLTGGSNTVFNSVATTDPDLYRLILNKDHEDSTATINTDFTLGASTNGATKALELQNGTLVLNNSGIDIGLTTGGGDFEIPGTAGLQVTQGTVNVSGDDTGIHLDGALIVDGGTVNMNDAVNNGNNYIEYSSSGDAKIDISAGSLTVGSQIRRGLFSSTGLLDYSQTGGTVVIGKNAAPEANRGVLEVLNAGSNFTHTGGDLTLVRQNGATPTTAALYLDPDTYDLAGSTITIGSADTPTSQDDIFVYSTTPLNNLTLNGSNSPSVKISVVPLSLDGNLTIASNNTLDGNGLPLTISGDFTNDGTYIPNGNVTEFNASTGTQTLSGSGTFSFFDLAKSGSSSLVLDDEITLTNDLKVDNGSTINTATYDLSLLGDATVDGSIISDNGLSYNGLVFNGSAQQTLQRSSVGTTSLDIVTINNANGVKIPEASSFVFAIGERIQLEAGVLDIGGASVELAPDADITTSVSFGADRMIVTNSADADKGLKKTFAVGTSDVSLADNQFVFPIGQDVYSPFIVDISGGTMGTTSGTVLIKPVDAYHPTVNDGTEDTSPTDLDNVLQYYWTVATDNITGFIGDFSFVYDQSDVSADDPSFSENDYITARIRSDNNPTGDINKNDGTVDTGGNRLRFSFSSSNSEILSADYFAGVDDAIPDQVPTYTVVGIGGLVNALIYNPIIPGGSEPKGAIVVVPSGATLTIDKNNIRLYRLEIESGGTVDVGTTTQHNFREITGTGTLRTESVTLPAGSYDFGCTGLALEYAGNSNYGLFSGISTIREVTISGTGTRTFAKNLLVCENLTIDGPTVQFTGDYRTQIDEDLILTDGSLTLGSTSDLDITNNMTLTAGSFTAGANSFINVGGNLTRALATFTASNSTLVLDGTTGQQIAGDFTAANAFENVTIDDSAEGVTVIDDGNNDIEIDGTLSLTDGLFITNSNNRLTMSSTSTVSGGSSASFVHGPLTRENISAVASYEFKVGKGSRYAPTTISQVGTGSQDWTAEHFTSNSNGVSQFDDSDMGFGSLDGISAVDMWTITSNGSNSARVQLTYGSHTGITDVEDTRVVIWDGAQWVNQGGTATGTAARGTVIAEATSSFSSKDFSVGSSNTPLPVDFLSFKAIAKAQTVQLQWKTASESNNDYFVVLRSVDGVNFKKIGEVAGAGTSNQVLQYKFEDKLPIAGIAYYQLKQVDYNGLFDYSDKVSVEWNNTAEKTALVELHLYPNPAPRGEAKLRATGLAVHSTVAIDLTDMYGRVKLRQTLKSDKLMREGYLLRPTQKLSAGVYIITLRQGNTVAQKSLIVR